MKLYIVRIEYHYEGSQDVLYSTDEATARGFYAGYCERLREQNKGSLYVSSQQDLDLLCVKTDIELEGADGEILIHKTLREIVGHAGK